MFKPIPKINYHAIWDINENTGEVYHNGKKPYAYNNYCKKGMIVGKWAKHKLKEDYYVCNVRVAPYGMFHLARILYYVYFGIDPNIYIVDHKDGNTKNMAKSNLRLLNYSDSCINRGKFKNNTTGITGVCKHNKGFKSEINHKNKRYRILTNDFFEACCFRKSMENKLGFTEIQRHRNI